VKNINVTKKRLGLLNGIWWTPASPMSKRGVTEEPPQHTSGTGRAGKKRVMTHFLKLSAGREKKGAGAQCQRKRQNGPIESPAHHIKVKVKDPAQRKFRV